MVFGTVEDMLSLHVITIATFAEFYVSVGFLDNCEQFETSTNVYKINFVLKVILKHSTALLCWC